MIATGRDIWLDDSLIEPLASLMPHDEQIAARE
jgi:hypothetical protein